MLSPLRRISRARPDEPADQGEQRLCRPVGLHASPVHALRCIAKDRHAAMTRGPKSRGPETKALFALISGSSGRSAGEIRST